MSTYDTEGLDHTEPGYLNSYGLREAPFSPVHQDKFLYLDAERAQRLSQLQHMTQDSNLLLIVEGERGVGKTCLMTRFINNAESDWCICEVTANTMMDAEQLLFQAAQGFNLHALPRDASQLQQMLYSRVATMHHNNEVPILIIDDAHELPIDALLTIFNLADTYVDEEHLLRIILFCEPQIEKILNSKDVKVLRERVTHTMDIPALDEDSTAEYLKHRLAVAGFSGGSPFTPGMIKRIYQASHGLPGRINLLAHETLEHGDFEQDEPEEQVTIPSYSKQPKPVVWISAAVVLIAVALVWQDWISPFSGEEQSQQEDLQPVNVAQDTSPTTPLPSTELTQTPGDSLQKKIIPLTPQTPVVEPQSARSAETAKEKADENKPHDHVIRQTAVNDIQESETVEEKVTEQPSVQHAVSELESIQLYTIKPDPIPANGRLQTISISGQGFTPQTEVIVSWTGKEKKLSTSQVRIENETQMEIDINVGRTADNWSIRVVDPGKGKSNLLGFQVTAVDDEPKRDKWVLAQNPEAFTLQLFGTNQKQSADNFMKQHAIQARSAYFHTQRNGKDWYSVVYGEYTDQDVARQSISTLPPAVQKLKPWVRRFDDIHASINAGRKVIAGRKTTPPKIPLAATPILKNASAEQHASWLWSQDPSFYTLQLLGARQSNSISRFLRKYSHLNGKAVYFHTRHEARDWYTVVYGVYPDRESARKAIDRLPAELKKSSPWVRSFASIHSELDRAE